MLLLNNIVVLVLFLIEVLLHSGHVHTYLFKACMYESDSEITIQI